MLTSIHMVVHHEVLWAGWRIPKERSQTADIRSGTDLPDLAIQRSRSRQYFCWPNQKLNHLQSKAPDNVRYGDICLPNWKLPIRFSSRHHATVSAEKGVRHSPSVSDQRIRSRGSLRLWRTVICTMTKRRVCRLNADVHW